MGAEHSNTLEVPEEIPVKSVNTILVRLNSLGVLEPVEPVSRGSEQWEDREVLEAISATVKSVMPEIDSTNELSGSTSSASANSSSATSQRGQSLGKYPLSKKAYVLVFHHYSFDDSTHDRAGSEKDIEKIRLFFQDYHVDRLTEATNKTAREVRYIMDMISCKDFSDYSCLITIIMSHGLENDRIEARDGETYCFEGDIVDKCTSNRTLDGKPKIFIVQACRGDSLIVADSRKTHSKKDDVLIFQSTYKGFVALRDIQNGTFFIQSFFDLLDEHRDKDISFVNKHLNHVFRQKGISQNPTMSTTLTKDFVFADLRIA